MKYRVIMNDTSLTFRVFSIKFDILGERWCAPIQKRWKRIFVYTSMF